MLSRDSGAAGDTCTDDSCKPAYVAKGGPASLAATIFSSLPFLVTFLAICLIAIRRIFPYLIGTHGHSNQSHSRSTSVYSIGGSSGVFRKISAVVFAITLGATAVLAELILCEI